MHVSDSKLIVSATDLSKFLACEQLTVLDMLTAIGAQARQPKYDDPALELLWARGHEHEEAYLQGLRDQDLRVEEIDDSPTATRDSGWHELASRTLDAMHAGADVIYQGVLFAEPWLGKPDFLRRVQMPSELGSWSYEVVDTKLAREAKAGAVLQITLYSDLLACAQGVASKWMTLALGGPTKPEERYRYADFDAYLRMVRSRFLGTVQAASGDADVAPDPCDHCQICAWKSRCAVERREVDHLSLVAGITRRQRAAFAERSVETLSELASFPLPIEPPLARSSRVAAERVREQARIRLGKL